MWGGRITDPAAVAHQNEVRAWIEALIGAQLPCQDFFSCIRDGKVLCRVAKLLVPEEEDVDPEDLLILENVDRFLQAAKVLGVPESMMFEPEDLFERKNLPKIVDCLGSLQQLAPAAASSSFAGVQSPAKSAGPSPAVARAAPSPGVVTSTAVAATATGATTARVTDKSVGTGFVLDKLISGRPLTPHFPPRL